MCSNGKQASEQQDKSDGQRRMYANQYLISQAHWRANPDKLCFQAEPGFTQQLMHMLSL
jgi:hypothetical protein